MSQNMALVSGKTPYRQFGDLGIWLITLILAMAGALAQYRAG
jgi:apolipoprotein N-acyltransferase